MGKLNVGDKVVFKSWEEMEKEFGLKENGNIACMFTFTREMRHFCGETGVVKSIDDNEIEVTFDDLKIHSGGYSFSGDMLKLNPSDLKIGDRVIFKEWDEMEKEYGLDDDEDIATTICFAKAMKTYCGHYVTIKSIDKDGNIEIENFDVPELSCGWYCFHTDMVKLPRDKNKKYTVGEKVKIRQWEDMEREFGLTESYDYIDIYPRFNNLMKKFCGTYATIKSVDPCGYITLDGNSWNWSPEMFETNIEVKKEEKKEEKKEVEKVFKVGDKVVIKEWREMEDEFRGGRRSEHESIPVRCGFVDDMKVFCGEVATIVKLEDEIVKLKFDDKISDDRGWSFSTDMIKLLGKKVDKAEFRVGDRVRIKSLETLLSDGNGRIDVRFGFPDSMRNLCGKTATIARIDEYYNPEKRRVYLKDWNCSDYTDWNYSLDMIEFADEGEVDITRSISERDGNKVTTTLYSGYTVLATGVARCHPTDTFDFTTGEKLATERAYEELKKKDTKVKEETILAKSGTGLIGREIKEGTRFKVLNTNAHSRPSYICKEAYIGQIGTFDESFTFNSSWGMVTATFEKDYLNAIDNENGRFLWRYDEVEILD